MKTIVNGLTVTIDEVDGEFIARATFEGYKIIELSATSSRDYAAVASLFDALKKQAIENLDRERKEKENKPMNYSDLMAVMAEFHAGKVTRSVMVAAIALWQRPIDCASPFGEDMKRAAVEAVIR